MDTTLSAPLGQLLDGRYLVESQIARGGMATVYQAKDVRLERTVAIKIAHPELARDEEFVSRFIGEARAVARLSSPNVVSVYDQGATGDLYYIAMEYVPGPTLRQLLDARDRLEPNDALAITERVLAGLAAAHDAGIIHRDVKPENVLLGNGSSVKVADFGLARAAAGIRHTRTGLIIGTAAYLAPEQVAANSSDQRTDVYATGVMLFEMLTGRQPHTGDSPLAVAYKHVNQAVPAPSQVCPDLPAALDVLVTSATSRDPELRPADASQYLRAVTEVRRALPRGAGADAAAAAAAGPVPAGRHAADPAASAGPGQDGAFSLYDPQFTGPVVGAQALADSPPPGASGARHTMVFNPAELPEFGEPPARAGRPRRGRGYREPFLQRWLFSRRILILPAVVVVALLAWWILAGQYATVPPLAGMSVASARSALSGAGLKTELAAPRHSNTVPAGEVISTSPAAGVRAGRGSEVRIVRSLGPVMISMPQVSGMTVSQAQKAVRAAGLQLGPAIRQTSGSIAAGIVITTRPGPFTSWPQNKPVQLVVSSGAPLPDFRGQQIGAAQGEAAAGGYTLNQVPDTGSTQPPGTITSQSPAANTPVTPGEVVTVNVSQGGAMTPVPDVRGESQAKATSDLKQAGFKVKVSKGLFGHSVTSYSPTGQAPAGSTITINIGYL